MNSIKQKIVDITKQGKVPVRVGSHKVQVHVHHNTTGLELIARCLEQCKIHNFNSYELYENVYGIERHVSKKAFISEYIQQWPHKNCCFRVRKNVLNSRLNETIAKSKVLRSKLFEMSRQMSSMQSIQDEHIYEDVKDSSVSKLKKFKINKLNKLKIKNNFRKLFTDFKESRNKHSTTANSSALMFILNEVNFDSTI